MNDYKFGNFICELREGKGLTQADIAKELGVTPAAVSKWENGSSKPRVEVLFRLAEILGVRVEELMAGHHIATETLDSETVKEINEQYAYLRRVDPYNTTGVKVRRMLAWVIDWNIIGAVIIVILCMLAAILAYLQCEKSTVAAVSICFIVLLYPICFILRDLNFGGRSIGKRIMGLVVIDKQSGQPAKANKRILRNLFLLVLQFDFVIMLVSGTTIGDRVAHTFVVPKKVLETDDLPDNISRINSYSKPKATDSKKIILLVVGSIILVVVLVVSVTLVALAAQKDTEEYQMSYQYLVESEAFKELNVDESKIWLNHYSRSTSVVGDSESGTVTIGFVVERESFQVICHAENGVWQVCDECTKFD